MISVIFLNFAAEKRASCLIVRDDAHHKSKQYLKMTNETENQVKIDGLTFVPYLTAAEIQKEVERVASELRRDLEGKKPHFLCVLNGAFVFAADLFRALGMNDAKINFVRYSSYAGTSSTGKVKELMGLNEDIEGKDIVIIEDIVDTGLTASKMVEDLRLRKPASIKFVTLLYKPDSNKSGFKPDYAAFSIPP